MGSFTIGLDLGQQDFTALVVVERLLVPPGNLTVEGLHRLAGRMVRPVEEYHVVHMARWPLGTAYPDIVNDVGRLTRRPPLSTDGLLVVDRTGVGTAVMDMFREAWRDGRLAGAHQPIGVTITGGEHGNGWNLPKADLISAVQTTLQSGRLRVAPGPLVDVLQREMLAFRQKITPSGRTQYESPRREGEGHGDLVMALALALAVPNTIRRPDLIDREAPAPVS